MQHLHCLSLLGPFCCLLSPRRIVFFQRVKPTLLVFFFFNDTATTEIYTLSLHDALPISPVGSTAYNFSAHGPIIPLGAGILADRKSTRLNSSHLVISYAVFCLKKKKNNPRPPPSGRTPHPSHHFQTCRRPTTLHVTTTQS